MPRPLEMSGPQVNSDLNEEPTLAVASAGAVSLLGKELSYIVQSFITSLMDTHMPTCNGGHGQSHLTLGHACLTVSNVDAAAKLQLWAQAVECYKCPPWPYLMLQPGTSQELAVNTTYPTDLYVRNTTGGDLYKLTYHFGEYGAYQLGISTESISNIKVLTKPPNEFLPLIVAFVFFFMLAFMWQCAKFFRYRMDSPCTTRRVRSVSAGEETSLLSSQPVYQGSPSSSQLHQTTPVAPSLLPQLSAGIPDSSMRRGRLQSLDTFRGLAIVIMVFVNYGGGRYYFFQHAHWNGLTVADLVFPWFMWIMGVSMIFSVRSQLQRTTKRYLMVFRILKRCAILFILGLIINSDNNQNYMPTLRIMGVLQRFAICYGITALMEVYLMNPQESPEYVWYWKIRDIIRSGVQWVITILLVGVHTAITFGLHIPGCPTGYLGPGGLHDGGVHGNCTGGAAAYVDVSVLGEAHIYSHPTCKTIYNNDAPYDPEGILGALMAVLTVQFGAAAGRIIITYQGHGPRIKRWLVWAVVCGLLAGFLCDWRKEGGPIPVNKNLWSLSFVLTTACFAFFLLSLLYLFIDKWQWWSGNPFKYPGMNSILIYVGHEIFGGLFPWSWRPVGETHTNYLIMNLWGTSTWVIIAYLCHKRKLYLSV
ncbi:heparan-alpha-glucosaminide N-acetyltransferase isoform X2 [Procambarus clarkii]|uniref:heparan-alpha-glucosaminide N-acetyltransferase isoform X2 n=1 Tax=Procambarus clarkii TaxID=6728 RepID=UPI001E67387C|nr:heparan-alpha-glucosaminide N-acetyltransferase-like isoform X2 [Procambarus clarkii]